MIECVKSIEVTLNFNVQASLNMHLQSLCELPLNQRCEHQVIQLNAKNQIL